MVRASTITIVDLAGSENLSQSGSNTGEQRAEAIKINQSLRALTHFLSLVGKAGQKSRRTANATVDPRVRHFQHRGRPFIANFSALHHPPTVPCDMPYTVAMFTIPARAGAQSRVSRR